MRVKQWLSVHSAGRENIVNTWQKQKNKELKSISANIIKHLWKRETFGKIAYSIMILGFIFLNYIIIAYGHSMLYDYDDYCCRHMSRDLEDQLESIGIPVTIIRASNDDNNTKSHMWISVFGIEFDSVNLFPSDSTEYIKLRYEFDDYDDYIDWRTVP